MYIFGFMALQVAEELGDKVRIVKIDTDENPELSSQLQVNELLEPHLTISLSSFQLHQ